MPTPSKFTAANKRIILDALMEGNSRSTAARLARVNPSQLSRWMEKGASAVRGSQYREFAEEVEMAEASAIGRALRILNSKMQDEPKWAAWFAERRDPAFAPPHTRQERQAGPLLVALSFDAGMQEMPVRSTVQQLPSAAS